MDRRDQGVGNVLALGHRGQYQFSGFLSRQILQAVHRDIDRFVKNLAAESPW